MHPLISLSTLLVVSQLVLSASATETLVTSPLRYQLGLPYLYPNYNRRIVSGYRPHTRYPTGPYYPPNRYPGNHYYPSNQYYPNDHYYPSNGPYYPGGHYYPGNYYPQRPYHSQYQPQYGYQEILPLSSDYRSVMVTRPLAELPVQTRTLPAPYHEFSYTSSDRGARNLPKQPTMDVQKNEEADNGGISASSSVSSSSVASSVVYEANSSPIPEVIQTVYSKPFVGFVESTPKFADLPEPSRPVSYALVPVVEPQFSQPKEQHTYSVHKPIAEDQSEVSSEPTYHNAFPDISASGLGQQYPDVREISPEIPTMTGPSATYNPNYYRMVRQPVVNLAPVSTNSYHQMSQFVIPGQVGVGGGYTSSSYAHDYMPKRAMVPSVVQEEVRHDSPVSSDSQAAKPTTMVHKKPHITYKSEDELNQEVKDEQQTVSHDTQDSKSVQTNKYKPDLGQYKGKSDSSDNSNANLEGRKY